MQPNTARVGSSDYRIYTQDNVHFPAAPISTFALRRVFGLAANTSRIVDFADLHGFWLIESCYISSPEDSELTLEILNSNKVAFYEDKLRRHETPKSFPTVLINNDLTLKLTAHRASINLLLIYLKPAYLEFIKDF